MKHPKWIYSGYEYRRNLPHYQRAFEPVFISFSTRNAWQLTDKCKDIVFGACMFQEGRNAKLHALVVMTTHVHLLCNMLFDSDQKLIPIRKLMHSIKSFTAHEINKLLKDSGPVWEEESFDRGIRSDRDFYERLEYIRMNPVRAGLVKRAEDYRWFWQDPEIKLSKKIGVGRN